MRAGLFFVDLRVELIRFEVEDLVKEALNTKKFWNKVLKLVKEGYFDKLINFWL